MPVPTASPLPLYYRVMHDLLEKIKSGDLPPDSVISPEVELVKTYGVSRNTIRHAIGLLAKDGYLLRIPGKGTFVLDRRGNQIRDQWVVSSIEDLLEISKLTRVDYGKMQLVPNPPAFVMEGLMLMRWNKVCLFQGLKYRNKGPISYLQTYVPYEIGIQIDPIKGQRTILMCMQEELGINVTQVDQSMAVGRMTQEDCERLKGTRGDPKVIITRVYFSEERPVEVTVNTYRGDQFSLFYRIFKHS